MPIFYYFPPVIGLAGRKRSGKDTTADLLHKIALEIGERTERIAFADPMRDGVKAMFGIDAADVPDREAPLFMGRSYRHIMQTLGTEWGRNQIHPNVWTEVALARTRAAISAGKVVLITDVRMANEAEMIRKLGGEVWRVENPRLPPPDDTHVSEVPVPGHFVSRVVDNSKDFAYLEAMLRTMLRDD